MKKSDFGKAPPAAHPKVDSNSIPASKAASVDKLESFSILEPPVVGASLLTHPVSMPNPAVGKTGKGKKSKKKGKSLKMAKSNTQLASKTTKSKKTKYSSFT